MDISREHFSKVCAPLQVKFKALLESTFAKAGISGKDVVVMDVFNSLAKTPWMLQTIEQILQCGHTKTGSDCRVRWVRDNGAGAALGAAYWAAGNKYVDNLVDTNPETRADELQAMAALDEGIGAIEAQEIDRRLMRAKLESFIFEMRQEALGSKAKLVQNPVQAGKVIKDAEAVLLQSRESTLEETRKMYQDFRAYFRESEPKLFEAVEAERVNRTEGLHKLSSRKMMDAVVRVIEEGGTAKLPDDVRLKRAKRDVEEAKQLVSSGQLELAELLGGRALTYLSDGGWATEDEKRTALAVQVECYLELARAKNLFAGEDRAVSDGHGILAEALENCGKALAIDAQNIEVLLQRAKTFMAMSDFTNAKKDVDNVLSLAPGNPTGSALQIEISSRQQA
ncbi:tetratricopeptide repeat-containing protein [Cystoisospora suis]|uniref:Tetratricopeptide repeat-containing protein n=1 Tax=Cystoisospora suis TaxID=483139 RepID=A0A2C6LG89_9APIC|nr:tetratricopeptide repeat-containing protein [Cystoisospora suis]